MFNRLRADLPLHSRVKVLTNKGDGIVGELIEVADSYIRLINESGFPAMLSGQLIGGYWILELPPVSEIPDKPVNIDERESLECSEIFLPYIHTDQQNDFVEPNVIPLCVSSEDNGHVLEGVLKEPALESIELEIFEGDRGIFSDETGSLVEDISSGLEIEPTSEKILKETELKGNGSGIIEGNHDALIHEMGSLVEDDSSEVASAPCSVQSTEHQEQQSQRQFPEKISFRHLVTIRLGLPDTTIENPIEPFPVLKVDKDIGKQIRCLHLLHPKVPSRLETMIQKSRKRRKKTGVQSTHTFEKTHTSKINSRQHPEVSQHAVPVETPVIFDGHVNDMAALSESVSPKSKLGNEEKGSEPSLDLPKPIYEIGKDEAENISVMEHNFCNAHQKEDKEPIVAAYTASLPDTPWVENNTPMSSHGAEEQTPVGITFIKKSLSYLDWNTLIGQYFFNEDNAGRDIIFFVNQELIDELGKPFGDNFDDFIKNLVDGPDFIKKNGENICRKAYKTFQWSRKGKCEYPPYLAYLALFVSAATVDGDYDGHEYYKKLKDLVGDVSNTKMSGCFSDIEELWDDLQRWSLIEKGELLGRFTKVGRGGLANLKYVYAQTVVSEKERKNWVKLFSEAGLDPTDPPAEEVLLKLLQRSGHYFENRTKKLLSSGRAEDRDLLNTLINLVISELERWDGIVFNTGSQPGLKEERWVKSFARVCISRKLGSFSSSIRFKVSEAVDFPEGDLELRLVEGSFLNEERYGGSVFSCYQNNEAGWSTPFQIVTGTKREDLTADSLDWTKSAMFEDRENYWRACFRPATVRVFMPGEYENLPDKFIEIQHLEHDCQFLVLCHESVRQKVVLWGESKTDSFDPVNSTGLPPGWSGYMVENAHVSCEGLEPLTLPTNIRLRLEGGIRRSTRGNEYLHFAPPTIIVEGGLGSVEVRANGITIPQNENRRMLWNVPSWCEIGKPITFEVMTNGEKSDNSRTIQLVDPDMIADFTGFPVRDRFGKPMSPEGGQQSAGYAIGAVVHEFDISECGTAPLGAPTYLSRSITFLGPEPGMIVRWPTEDLPSDWDPIWALAKTVKGAYAVHYCGVPEELNDTISIDHRQFSSRKKRKEWREAVWIYRKRNVPPRLPDVQARWTRYEREAKNV